MVIYLQHPVHGTKIAISDLEANYDEKHGWERVEDDKENTNSLKKRGRPTKESVAASYD